MAVVVFVIDDFTGHFNCTFRMARRLTERGHRVVYFGAKQSRDKVAQQGFEFRSVRFLVPLPSAAWLQVAKTEAGQLSGAGRVRRWFHAARQVRARGREVARALSTVVQEVDELVDEFRPDLLVFDPFLLIYSIAFHHRRVPIAALSTKPLLDYDPLVPPYTSAVLPRSGVRGRLAVEWAWAKQRAVFVREKLQSKARSVLVGHTPYSLAKLMAEQTGFPLRREWVSRPVGFDCCFRSVPELVLFPEEFDFPRARPLRSTARYIGPSVDLARIADTSCEAVPANGKVVFCSLGTVTFTDREKVEHVHRLVIQAFEARPDWTCLISLGRPGLATAGYRNLPRNVRVYDFLPQLEVLPKSALMITHGGASSIRECVLSGVPMLVYPRRADQPGNAARVVYRGLGLRGGDPETLVGLNQKLDHVLGSSAFRENLSRMRLIFQRYQDEERDVSTLEALCRPRSHSVLTKEQPGRGSSLLCEALSRPSLELRQ